MLEHGDKNKDGKLTKDEVPGFMWTRLTTADTDKDGAVSKTELEEHFKKVPAFGPHHAVSHGFGPGRGPRGFGFGGPPSADRLLEHADKNKDGKLTKDELPEGAWTRLSAADTDKDGAVSKVELEAHIKQRHDAAKPDAEKSATDKPEEKATDKPDDKPAETKSGDAAE